MNGEARIDAFGDAALLVTFGNRVDRGLNRRARALAAAIDRARAADPRFGRPVTAFASVLVPFDPIALDDDAARDIVGALLRGVDAGRDASDSPDGAGRSSIEVPVRYGGAEGPDLDELASLHGLTPADVVELHAATTYEVFFLGFAPGFAYLGTVPPEIATPRLARPRERVPAGSIGIAGEQTGIYPFAMPGGWRLIGRTDRVVWDTERERPALLMPGDRVRFVPVR